MAEVHYQQLLTFNAPVSGINQIAVHLASAVLDEVEAVFGVAAHQLIDQLFHRKALLVFGGQGDADEAAAGGVHRGFAQLAGVHFAQAL